MTRDPRRRGFAVVVVAVLAILGVWAFAPPRTPPLYDGVGFPDEPYRYVHAPAGATAKQPTAGSARIAVQDGASRSGSVATAEQGPQAALFFSGGAFDAPRGADAVEVRVEPVALPSAPADGTVPGNAYRISASAVPATAAAAVTLSTEPNAANIQLRIPKATSQTVAIELLVGARWEQLTTFRTGTDVYSASVPTMGTLAAVVVTDPSRSVAYAGSTLAHHGGGGVSLAPLLAGVVLLALAALVVGVRISRRRAARPAARDPAAGDPARDPAAPHG